MGKEVKIQGGNVHSERTQEALSKVSRWLSENYTKQWNRSRKQEKIGKGVLREE